MSILPLDFKFIDLFAGIGGFHLAMKKLSNHSECVFASEINKNAIKLYELNFGISSNNDITKTNYEKIEPFDVVCAGFPCQPFSKAGYQNGFNDVRGTLFFNIISLIDAQIKNKNKPKLIILENVRNLATHDNAYTWQTIYSELTQLGYNVIKKPLILSPKDFNIPQLRDRAIILAVDNDLYQGEINFKVNISKNSKLIDTIYETLKSDEFELYKINDYEEKVLDAWDYFIKKLSVKTIGYPIWSDEFGKVDSIDHFPKWKQNFINKNRLLYVENKEMIDVWFEKFNVKSFKKTQRKFEWQAGATINSVYEGLIQFRPSGVRVKKPDYAPTLVAMAHVPIIGKFKRYMTPNETAKLQSLPDYYDFDSVGKDIYRLLGNAVNVDVIYNVTKQFVDYIDQSK